MHSEQKYLFVLTYIGTKISDNLSKIPQALRLRGGDSEQAESHGGTLIFFMLSCGLFLC